MLDWSGWDWTPPSEATGHYQGGRRNCSLEVSSSWFEIGQMKLSTGTLSCTCAVQNYEAWQFASPVFGVHSFRLKISMTWPHGWPCVMPANTARAWAIYSSSTTAWTFMIIHHPPLLHPPLLHPLPSLPSLPSWFQWNAKENEPLLRETSHCFCSSNTVDPLDEKGPPDVSMLKMA